jgi:SAM-dependent methyltransferase
VVGVAFPQKAASAQDSAIGLRRTMTPLLENPRVYDLVQRAAGAAEIRRRLAPHVRAFAGTRVLDVGAGTGAYVGTVRDPAEYVALDLDSHKLARLSAKHDFVDTVVGDATNLEFPPARFDHALVVFLAHHLDDEGLGGLVAGLSRVVSGTVVLVDPLQTRALRGRLLWAVDRGSFPRTADRLLTALEREFVIESEERFQIHHSYLLCVARPTHAATSSQVNEGASVSPSST